MTIPFLALAGVCAAVFILSIAAAANTPTDSGGQVAVVALLGIPAFIALAALSWLFGG